MPHPSDRIGATGALFLLCAALSFLSLPRPVLGQPRAGEMRTLPPISVGQSLELQEALERQPDSDPAVVRVVLRWDELQRSPGEVDLEPIDRLMRALPGDRFAVLVCLTGGNPALRDGGGPPGAGDEAYRDAWLKFARTVAERTRDWADLFQVWNAPQSPEGWGAEPSSRDYAFLLKSTAVTIRSVIPWARVATGGLDATDPSFLEELYSYQAAPYTDAVSIDGAPDRLSDEQLERFAEVVRRNDASSPVWFSRIPVDASEPVAASGQVSRQFGMSVGRGAALGLFEPASGDAGPAVERTLEVLRRRFPATTAPVPAFGDDQVRQAADRASISGVRVYRFFDPETELSTLWYDAPPASGELALVLPTDAVSDPRVVDPSTDREEPIALFIPDRASGTTRIDVPLSSEPRLLVYRRRSADRTSLPSDAVEVAGGAELSVEEILARHQEHQSAQQDRLSTYTASAQLDLHFQLGGSDTFDVTYKVGFYFDDGVAEWVQREFYLNGVRWKGKKIPKIPLVQPDKVVILPLDLHLDKRYQYVLEGSETIDGRLLWRISFEPIDPDATLYRGKVWIDQRNFARVQMALRQRGMEAPFVSNDEVDHYRPVVGPDGEEYWILTEIDGSQLYSVAGRSFNVTRRVAFSEIRINPEDFDERIADAYASDKRILRDTDQGFRYLEKDKEGERYVEDKMDRDQLFWLGGVFYNTAAGVIPLVGVNYFSFDVAGSGTQMNVFFALAFLALNATDPDLFGGPVEGGIDLGAQAIDFTDSLFVDGEEIEDQDVARRTQRLRLFLGAPFRDFFRIVGGYELEWDKFSRAKETAPDFAVPVDTFIHNLDLNFRFNRRGWSYGLGGTYSRRQTWEPWGTPEQQAEFDPSTKDYYTWETSLSKNIFLPKFQKVRVAASWAQGYNLDRFSSFGGGGFAGGRIRGFSGTGVRFERVGVLETNYAFDVFEVVRFEAGFDFARGLDPAESPDYRNFLGFGLDAEFMGPWGTLMNLSWGIAVHSDIPSVEGEMELFFSFLKLF